MSENTFATLEGQPCGDVELRAFWIGVWSARVEIDGDAVPTGAVTLQLGDTAFRGTVDDSRSGVFAGKATAFIVGGAGGWGTVVSTQPYHNDGGVKRSQVATDIAAAAGETIVVSSAADGTVVDWPRELAPAARLLEQLFPGTPWWVGNDGITRVGARTTRDVSQAVQMLEHHPEDRSALLAAEEGDMSVLLPGSSVVDLDRLGATPFVVRDVVINVTASKVRATAFSDSIGLAAREFVRERTPRATFLGTYRYRVFDHTSERVRLQAYKDPSSTAPPNLPDILPVPITPGMAGLSTRLTPGAVVLVSFIEGNPELPIVTHFTREGDPGFLPVEVSVNATSVVKLGGGSQFVALANLVRTRFQQLALALFNGVPVAGTDGGAGLQTSIKGLLVIAGWDAGTGQPPDIAATKVKAT